MALLYRDDSGDDQDMGDSVCSTLSDCSLLGECSSHLRQAQRSRRASGLRLNSWCSSSSRSHEFADDAAGDAAAAATDGADDNAGDAGDAVPDSDDDEGAATDGATYRSATVRQFRGDLDRLAASVTQSMTASCRGSSRGASPRLTAGGADCTGQLSAPASNSSVISVVKSSCLRLLLSRVLPPLLESFEQRLISSLLSSGLLPENSDADQQDQTRGGRSRQQLQAGADDSLELRPMPAPRPRQRQPLPSPHEPAPRPPPRRLHASCQLSSQKQPQQWQPQQQQQQQPQQQQQYKHHQRHLHQQQKQHVASPYFVASRGQPMVRNNSSLKQPPISPTPPAAGRSHRLPPSRLPSLSQPPALSSGCDDLVRTFLVRDSPSLRAILFDPDDRKMKSISQRYGCYISVFEKTKRVGHLLHKIVIRAPSEKALRMCTNALDSGLSWDLASQMNRANSKRSTAVATTAPSLSATK